MVKRSPRTELEIEEFGNRAERQLQPPAAAKPSAVTNVTKGEPAWKRRNRESKHRGVQFRCSDSQLDLLQAASIHQEKSMQKILEAIVWPVLEEQYGPTKDSPS